MAPWYDRLVTELAEIQPAHRAPGDHIMETVSISPDRIRGFAQRMGLDVIQSQEGEFVALPPNVDLTGRDGEVKLQFIDHWLEETVTKSRVENERNRRIQTYKIMDDALAEACIALDTYADECLAIGFVEDPIQIQFSDKGVGRIIQEILDKNEIIKKSRSFIRNQIKYGDLGLKLILPRADDETDETDIGIEYVDPLQWECVVSRERHIAIGYKLDDKFNRWVRNPSSRGGKKRTLQPWEFVQMTVFDQDFKPYGRSLLEAMRIDFDHLVTLEALLALSRASRVERLLIKMPTGSTNPVQAALKIQSLKAQFKNIIFKDTSLGTKTYGKTAGLTDILFMPSDQGFDATRLPSSIDLSSVEDVEYFRNKAITSTGLPKGYFLADQVTDRGSALQAQDIKFARKLIQYQNSWIEGLTRLCMTLAVYVTKTNFESFEVQIGLKKPPQLALSMITAYTQIAETASMLIQNWKTSSVLEGPDGQPLPGTGLKSMPGDMYMNLLLTLGMPANVARMFSSDGKQVAPGGAIDYVVIKSSNDPEFAWFRPTLKMLSEKLIDPKGFAENIKRLDRLAA
jgi:hypothetical protein